MKILIDMNLSPNLVPLLIIAGHEAVHWSNIGDPRAKDSEILNWARVNKYILLTHYSDFGAILAATKSESPSILQVRTQGLWTLKKFLIKYLLFFNPYYKNNNSSF